MFCMYVSRYQYVCAYKEEGQLRKGEQVQLGEQAPVLLPCASQCNLLHAPISLPAPFQTSPCHETVTDALRSNSPCPAVADAAAVADALAVAARSVAVGPGCCLHHLHKSLQFSPAESQTESPLPSLDHSLQKAAQMADEDGGIAELPAVPFQLAMQQRLLGIQTHGPQQLFGQNNYSPLPLHL